MTQKFWVDSRAGLDYYWGSNLRYLRNEREDMNYVERIQIISNGKVFWISSKVHGQRISVKSTLCMTRFEMSSPIKVKMNHMIWVISAWKYTWTNKNLWEFVKFLIDGVFCLFESHAQQDELCQWLATWPIVVRFHDPRIYIWF